MKRIIIGIIAFVFGLSVTLAQTEQKSKLFSKFDIGVTLGTTGIGADISTPINEYLQVRAGFSIMPRFHYDMDFGIQVGDDPATSAEKFTKLSGLLTQLTGNPVDDHVTMVGRPYYSNFNFMVDVFPFKNNKHWHFTAGFFLGDTKVADAVNSIEYMQTLMAVNIYNVIYDKVQRGEPIISYNGNDIYLDPAYEDKVLNYGRMGIHVGDFKDQYVLNADGTTKLDANGNPIHKPYMMEPNSNGTVSANASANAFKPYLGFGYGGRLIKNNDKYHISVDCGAMFWGGTADVVTHDGVNLTKDLINIRGDVDDYVQLAKRVKVFPVLNLRVSRTF